MLVAVRAEAFSMTATRWGVGGGIGGVDIGGADMGGADIGGADNGGGPATGGAGSGGGTDTAGCDVEGALAAGPVDFGVVVDGDPNFGDGPAIVGGFAADAAGGALAFAGACCAAIPVDEIFRAGGPDAVGPIFLIAGGLPAGFAADGPGGTAGEGTGAVASS